MLERIYSPGIEREVRALVPRDGDSALTDTTTHLFKRAWSAMLFGLSRSFFAFLALCYLPIENYSGDVVSGLIHLMFTLWLLGYAFQLASIIRDELDASESTSFLTLLPAIGETRVNAILRSQFWFLAALPIELLVWHLAAAFSLGQPLFSHAALASLSMAALVITSVSIILLRFTFRIPHLNNWLSNIIYGFLIAGFVAQFVTERIPLMYGIERVINFLGSQLGLIGDAIPIGWFFQPSLGESIHPLELLGGFLIIGVAAFFFKAVYNKLVTRTEQQVAEMSQIDLDLLLLGMDDFDDYLDELMPSGELPQDSPIASHQLISEPLKQPSPASVLPGNSWEDRLLRRNLDEEEFEIMETFHRPAGSARTYLIRAWTLIGLLVAGQFLTKLFVLEPWVIFFQMTCSIFAILSLCRFGSGLSAAYAESGAAGNTSATAVLFPVSMEKLSALRMKLVGTFSLIHLPPGLFIIAAYWLCQSDAFDLSRILIGGLSFAIFGTAAFFLLQWFTTAILLLKMGRSFFNFALYSTLVLFVTLNFSWFFVISSFFALKFGDSWFSFGISATSLGAVCAITYFIGMRRLRKPTVDLCGKPQDSFGLT